MSEAGSASTSTFKPTARAMWADSRAYAAKFASLDRFVQMEGISPKRLISEGFEAEHMTSLSYLSGGITRDSLIRGCD